MVRTVYGARTAAVGRSTAASAQLFLPPARLLICWTSPDVKHDWPCTSEAKFNIWNKIKMHTEEIAVNNKHVTKKLRRTKE
jgi:hypothetical protein